MKTFHFPDEQPDDQFPRGNSRCEETVPPIYPGMRLDSANVHFCRTAHRRSIHYQVQPIESSVVERTCAEDVHGVYKSFHRVVTICQVKQIEQVKEKEVI